MNVSFTMLRTAVTAGLAAIAITGCSTPDRSTSQVWNDRMIAHRVKKDLAHAPVFKYPYVSVNAFYGAVQLAGFVDTEEQRDEAAEIASRTRGVNQVVNNIMIKPMATGRATVRDPLWRETGRMTLGTNAPPREALGTQPKQVTPAPTYPPGTQPAPEEKQP